MIHLDKGKAEMSEFIVSLQTSESFVDITSRFAVTQEFVSPHMMRLRFVELR